MNRPYQQPGQGSREQRRAARRAAEKRSAATASEPPKAVPQQSAEAFCLMWYACECGHRERIWNSRDGVTPFGMSCPSCGEAKLFHVNFGRDTYAPDHVPRNGQRIWISMSKDRARQIARRTAERIAAARKVKIDDAMVERIATEIYRDGAAPDIVVWGYVEAE
ncbi:hypothetical protein [Paraburkholderia caribensis]|uniref:hypothetical protein n=1 Tax=Paraburkholderia caribensis TaxID=75105 RepID=UPI0028549E15|nr:hypothetical protein [Paraburkholderia caribensis]MDR6381784.1 ribosomal protein L32 [Paraburkholderia caribensis]